MPTRINLYFDLVSPWSWLAFQVLRRYREAWDIDLQFKPLFLGGVMQASGNKPPMTVENKGRYMLIDLKRASAYLDVPMRMPSEFPWNSLVPIRFLYALAQRDPSKIEKVAERLFEAANCHDRPPKTADGIREALLSPSTATKENEPVLSSEELSSLLELIGQDSIKNGVKEDTIRVVKEKGVFGFPWMEVIREGEQAQHFFGTDSFVRIAYYLGKDWNGAYPNKKRTPTKL